MREPVPGAACEGITETTYLAHSLPPAILLGYAVLVANVVCFHERVQGNKEGIYNGARAEALEYNRIKTEPLCLA